MALTRFTVTRDTTVRPSAPAADHTGGRHTTGTGWSGVSPETFHAGQVIVADPDPGNGPASALFTAIGAANLRELEPTGRPAVSN
jgi:hypothetical protein